MTFQSGAFQNNAFQSSAFTSLVIDTHDGIRKKHKRIFLPIYEIKKHKRIENLIEVEQYAEPELERLPAIPKKAIEWDNSQIEAFAKVTAQKIVNIERQIEAIKKHEDILNEDEEEFFMLAKSLSLMS